MATCNLRPIMQPIPIVGSPLVIHGWSTQGQWIEEVWAGPDLKTGKVMLPMH